MVDKVRVIAIGGTVGAIVAGCIVAPAVVQAFAEEPAKVATTDFTQIFTQTKPFNPDELVKFHITAGPGVSTTVTKTAVVAKISYGHREWVSIVTTPSGTYSSDALTSPYVRYPGIDVTSADASENAQSYATFSTPSGMGSWTSITRGSITWFDYSFTPAKHFHS